MNSRYNREFLHAAAITKLIEDARNKKIIELSSLDEYFEKSMSYVNQEYYKHKIMQLIESISEAYINQVFETHTGFLECCSQLQRKIKEYIFRLLRI